MAEAIRNSPLVRWPRHLLNVSPQNAYAIRFGVVVMVATWIGKAPGLLENSSTWILITGLMLSQPTSGGSLMKGLLRAAGTLAGAVSAIVLFGLFAQNPPMLMIGLLLIQVIAAYGYTGPRYKYAWFVWAFTTAIVLGAAMVRPEAVETLAFQRASMVGIGILIVFVVDSIFWPARSEPRLRSALAARARQLGEALEAAVTWKKVSENDASTASALAPAAMANQLALIGELQAEIGVSRARADGLMRITFLLEALASRARALTAPIAGQGEAESVEPARIEARRELALRLAGALGRVAGSLERAQPPQPYSNGLDRALLNLDEEWRNSAVPGRRDVFLEERLAYLRDLIAVLRVIEEVLSSDPAAEATTGADAPDPVSSWRPDPFRTKIALRAGLAVVAALLCPIVLGWPLNTTVAPVAFMMAALNRGAVIQTLSGLALAVGAGWLIADLLIVFVTPVIDEAPLAPLLVFVLAAAFVLISQRLPRFALLPSIGGLVVFLSVFGGSGATTNVEGSYSTVSYMALGSGFGWLFSQIMWPATASSLFRERLAGQLASCLETLERDDAKGDEGRIERRRALMSACIQQSTQLAALHGQARLEPVERSLDEGKRTEILALMTELVDAILGDRNGALAALGERSPDALRPLMDAFERSEEVLRANLQRAVAVMRGEPVTAPVDLESAYILVDQRIAELRRNREALPALGEEETHRIVFEISARRRIVERQIEIDRWMKSWFEADGRQVES